LQIVDVLLRVNKTRNNAQYQHQRSQRSESEIHFVFFCALFIAD